MGMGLRYAFLYIIINNFFYIIWVWVCDTHFSRQRPAVTYINSFGYYFVILYWLGFLGNID